MESGQNIPLDILKMIEYGVSKSTILVNSDMIIAGTTKKRAHSLMI
jgi:hypothetical protein